MRTTEGAPILPRLLSELVEGTGKYGDALTLNTGDRGMLGSLAGLSAAEASQASRGGATIAAHVQHLRYGLSLMNRWATEGMDAYANPLWDEAWKITAVDEPGWREIQAGFEHEARRWLAAVGDTERTLTANELAGMIASLIHLGYHLGAIRQIAVATRGPKEGTFREPVRKP